jgi:hypothetical protein
LAAADSLGFPGFDVGESISDVPSELETWGSGAFGVPAVDGLDGNLFAPGEVVGAEMLVHPCRPFFGDVSPKFDDAYTNIATTLDRCQTSG